MHFTFNNTLIDWYFLLIIIAGVYFLILSVTNIAFLKVKSKKPSVTDGQKVSVLIPARDEENNIRKCLDSLIHQTYENYEIIVYDDMSTDGTYNILKEYREKYPLITAVKGTELPDGWFGKPHAMQELAKHAGGDYYIFTDADTIHNPESISWAVTNILHHNVDYLSGCPLHATDSFGEALCVPGIYLNCTLFLPLWLIPITRASFLSHSIGQFVIFKASTFKAIKGYTQVRNKISEDIHIGREVKRQGYTMTFLDAKEQVKCCMYNDISSFVNSISKNVYDFFNKQLHPIMLLSLFILGFVIVPFVILFEQLFNGGSYLIPITIGVSLFFLSWLIFLYSRKFSWYSPFLYPLLFLIIIFTAWKSVIKNTFGKGYLWKGRFVR